MSQRIATVVVDRSLVESLFPAGTEIVSIAPSRYHGCWDFTVRHHELPPVAEGEVMRTVRVVATKAFAHYEVIE